MVRRVRGNDGAEGETMRRGMSLRACIHDVALGKMMGLKENLTEEKWRGEKSEGKRRGEKSEGKRRREKEEWRCWLTFAAVG